MVGMAGDEEKRGDGGWGMENAVFRSLDYILDGV